MTEYNYLDKILHRQFVGDSALSKFLFERLIKKSRYKKDHNLADHIFITGLARSGTTALLNKIYSSGEIPSIIYKDMPFVLSGSLSKYYSKFSSNHSENSIERFHNDGIQINNNSPECFDEIYWLKSFSFITKKQSHELIEISEKILHGYSYLLYRHASIKGNRRLLVKNNNNHQRLPYLSMKFPNANFLVMVRDPISHAISLLNQHLNFLEIQRKNPFVLEYMNSIGHYEFGLNTKPFVYLNNNWFKKKNKLNIDYWISQWTQTYKWILESNILKNKNISLILYEDLCKNKNAYKEVCELVSIKNIDTGIPFKFANGKYKSNLPKINEINLNYANNLYCKLREESFLN